MNTYKHIIRSGKILNNWLVDYNENLKIDKNSFY